MRSQNPFKSKSENSRFSRDIFFNDDQINKQESSQVKEKKNNIREEKKEANTFLSDKEKYIKQNQNNHVEKSRNNRDYNKYKKNEVIKEVIFDINIEEFPELGLQKNSESTIACNEKKFSDIVKTINIIEEDNSNIIRPGWIIIAKNKENGKIEVTNGEMTKFQKKQQETSQNISYIMRQIYITLNEIWDRNISVYDAINGEGAYEERFYLPPVYDDFEDYNKENEIDENNNEFNNDEYISDIEYHSDYY